MKINFPAWSKCFLLMLLIRPLSSEGQWLQKASLGMGTDARASAVSFTVNGRSYLSTGNTELGESFNDLWEFIPGSNTWVQRAYLPAAPRHGACAFTIDTLAYVCFGQYNSVAAAFKDVWEYNSTTDSWRQCADFPGEARVLAFAFSVGHKGYIGGGGSGSGANLKDFWSYDPANDSWTQLADFKAGVRYAAVAFTIGKKGYVGLGIDGNSFEVFQKDLWEYNPARDTWTQKAMFPGYASAGCASFTLCGKAYVLPKNSNDFWQYDPLKDAWFKKAAFPGPVRSSGAGFSNNSQGVEKGYIATGALAEPNVRINDLWEYMPDSCETFGSDQDVVLYPNPATNSIRIRLFNFPDHVQYKLTDLSGRVDIQGELVGDDSFILMRNNLASGIYMIRFYDQDNVLKTGKVIFFDQ